MLGSQQLARKPFKTAISLYAIVKSSTSLVYENFYTEPFRGYSFHETMTARAGCNPTLYITHRDQPKAPPIQEDLTNR
jgi:hypothetical protein